MDFGAVVFDLDGTLLNTLADIGDAGNAVLRDRGFPEHPLEAYRYFVGDGARTLATRILPEDRRDEETVEGCLAAFKEEYNRHWDRKTGPYDGVPEMLDALAERGLPMAVLSNKPDEFTRRCVDRLLASWSFDVVFGLRDGVPKKPDPAAALEIAGTLDVAPSKCLYVGDTATDMQTAVAAGMFPMGALWGFRTREELEQHGAQLVIGRPQELLGVLG